MTASTFPTRSNMFSMEAASERSTWISPDREAAEIELALAGLATGEYVLEITAAGEAGESKELLAFRITG